MNGFDRAYDRLRRANPEPTRPIDDKPTALEMLATVRRSRAPEPPRQWRRGLPIAAAAAVVVLVVAVPILLFLNSGDEEPPVVTEPPTPTTIPDTTAPEITVEPELAPLSEVIVGAWLNTWGTTEFGEDGTFRTTTGGELRDVGTYQVIGDLMTFRSTAESRDCPGLFESYAVTILGADQIAVTLGQEFVTPDTCVDRLTQLDTSTLTRTQPAPVAPESINAATQELVETFVATYNADDIDAFAAFLHPDFRREIILDRDPLTQSADTVRTLYEVDTALNTEIVLDCVAGAADAVCSPTRFDDLHRVLGIPPSEVTDWFLTFEDGLLRTWSETRPNPGTIPYGDEAVGPFSDWVIANRPDVFGDGDWEDRFFSGGTGTWVPRDGIGAEIAALVAEWAVELGVTLAG